MHFSQEAGQGEVRVWVQTSVPSMGLLGDFLNSKENMKRLRHDIKMARTLGKSLSPSEPESCKLPNENDTHLTYYCELRHRHEIYFAKYKALEGGATSSPSLTSPFPSGLIQILGSHLFQ